MKKKCSIIFGFLLFLVIINLPAYSQSKKDIDSVKTRKDILEKSRVHSTSLEGLDFTIQNVDVSTFPIIKVIVEAYNREGYPVDTLNAADMTIMEDGIEKNVISVEKISPSDIVPVDFMFIIDQTGSMQKYIEQVIKNINRFTFRLRHSGIDYRLGLILFSDKIEDIYSFTDDVNVFKRWLTNVKAGGGKDEKENALEALLVASQMNYRPVANRVNVIITDAPYHQKGEDGVGATNQTTESIIDTLRRHDMRLFAIIPAVRHEYKTISEATRGRYYNIQVNFSDILNKFSTQLTNLFALKYNTNKEIIPDSVDISLLDPDKNVLVRKRVSVLDVGRPFIIENLLYKTGSSELADTVKELDIIAGALETYPKIKIRIEGHTDSRGSARSNQNLSERRAESVKNYLMKKGISRDRMQVVGFGEDRPISTNRTAQGRKLNRRTEVIIISKD